MFLIEKCFHRDTTAFVAEIINTIGQASATAQGNRHPHRMKIRSIVCFNACQLIRKGLSTPVTSANRLRNADDQVIYLMTENEKK